MRDTDIAWLAGFFDGEGSVSIYRQLAKRRHPTVCIRLAFTHTHWETIERIMALLEEIGVSHSRADMKPRESQEYTQGWNLRVLRVMDIHLLASAMIPYAVTKRRQLEIAYEYTEMKLGLSKLGEDGKMIAKFTADPYPERTEAYLVEIQRLNRRGPAGVERALASKERTEK